MKINVIATGSSGNLYEILDRAGNSILIEAGVPRSTYMKFREGAIPPEFCIISHEHGDHAGYKSEYNAVIKTELKPDRIASDNFKALSFELMHGETKTCVFLIKSLVEGKFLFFGTDFQLPEILTSEYESLFADLKKFDVDSYLIECNYNHYLYHLADDLQRIGCDRHLSDSDLVRFMRLAKTVAPKIVTIHGSNRLCADSYTKKYLSSKIAGSKVEVATGVKGGQKNIYLI